MKTSLLVVAVAVLVAVCSAIPAERYTSKFDNIDLDAVLRNERLSRKYVDCLLAKTDEGCTADAKLLKREYSSSHIIPQDFNRRKSFKREGHFG